MNNKNALFTLSSKLKKRRHYFDNSFSVKTTFNAGQLIPLAVLEALPGDEYKINLSHVLRALTPLYPVLDNSFLDVFAFAVPNRTVWDHWESFITGSKSATPGTPADYNPGTEYVVPCVQIAPSTSSNSYEKMLFGSFWDYVGCGVGNASSSLGRIDAEYESPKHYPYLNALYPRGYTKIWNEWFRDENYQQPALLYTDDADRQLTSPNDGSSGNSYQNLATLGQYLCPVNKYHDYFTSALPKAQKGSPVEIPLAGGVFPVDNIEEFGASATGRLFSPRPYTPQGTALPGDYYLIASGTENELVSANANTTYGSPINFAMGVNIEDTLAVDINTQRLAFASQRFKEALARMGSRYTEYLQGIFGVYASDSRLDRSEFLGGKSIPIRQHQVAQTAETEQDIGLGATGAFSFTSSTNRLVNYTFKEHGLLYILACVRTIQSYSQGVERKFTRRYAHDYYNPYFAHIGEQPIKEYEIFADSTSGKNNDTFGFKEAWAEYRYEPNKLTAYMRPNVSGSLAAWHYGCNFSSQVYNSSEFLKQGVSEIDRTLAVGTSADTHQFFGDFYFKIKTYKVMPFRSTPGLIDHIYH